VRDAQAVAHAEDEVLKKQRASKPDETYKNITPAVQAIMGSPDPTAPHPGPFEDFRLYTTVNLTSYYPDGRGVTTPVWFVLVNDKVYVRTDPDTYKIERIQATIDVEIEPSDMKGNALGPTMQAKARILKDIETDKKAAALKAMKKKYGFPYRVTAFLHALISRNRGVYIEIWRD